MENAESTLVIILSVTLTVFLIAAIVLTIKLVKLVNYLSEIAEKAHQVADNVEHAADLFKKTAGPLAVGKLLANVIEMVTKRKKGK